jgi:hypothetical protein
MQAPLDQPKAVEPQPQAAEMPPDALPQVAAEALEVQAAPPSEPVPEPVAQASEAVPAAAIEEPQATAASPVRESSALQDPEVLPEPRTPNPESLVVVPDSQLPTPDSRITVPERVYVYEVSAEEIEYLEADFVFTRDEKEPDAASGEPAPIAESINDEPLPFELRTTPVARAATTTVAEDAEAPKGPSTTSGNGSGVIPPDGQNRLPGL